MNKLEIARLINTLAGTQGTIDTTEGTSGYQVALVGFLDQAYSDIQLYRNNWKFMRRTAEIPLNRVDPLYTYSNDDIDTVSRIYLNYRVLKYIDYDLWVLKEHQEAQPTEYTVNSFTDEIEFNPLDSTYIVTMDYQKVPDVLSSNSAVPILPTRFHSLIAYKALTGLGSYLGNPDLITKYTLKYSMELGSLMRSQVPGGKLLVASPLV